MKGKKYRLVAWILTGILGLFIVFAVWYKLTYSMDKVAPYSINSKTLESKLLIATQGSVFKDALVTRITDHYKADSVFIQVVDVSSLPKLDVSDYSAVFILLTWEYDRPPEAVTEFVKKNNANNKLVVLLSTSGEGGNTIEGVDGIGGESLIDGIPDYSMRIIDKLDVLLGH